MHKRFNFKTILLIGGDFFVLYGALIASIFLRYRGSGEPLPLGLHYLPFLFIFTLWLIVFGSFGLYDLKFAKNERQFLLRLIQAMMANIVVAIIVLYLIPFFEIEPRRNLLLIAAFGTVFIALWRFLYNFFIAKTLATKVLFLGVNKETIALTDFLLAHPQLGHKPIALMSVGENGSGSQNPLPHIGENNAVPHILASHNLSHAIKDFSIDTIVITREIKENRTLVTMLFEAIPLGVSVVEFTAFHEMLTGKIPMSLIAEIWFLENLIGSKKRSYEFFKRMFDTALALVVVGIGLALLPAIAIAIKLESKGPIFFRQKRMGRNGIPFTLIKFRSMVENAETFGGKKQLPQDSRLTRVGAFLRKNYLDELPQAINVIRGEMSFIGPRPERPEFVTELKKNIPFYEMRLLVPPGMTGWAQINMKNDASVEDAPEKMQYDLYYIKNRSSVLDLLIALKTAFTLLLRQGR